MPEIIRCKTSKKPLARVENGLLYLWCKRCATEHPVTRQELLKLLDESKNDNHVA